MKSLIKYAIMGKGKALILGSSLLIASSSFASSTDLFESTDLGTTKEVKEGILKVNEVEGLDINFSATELNCAYGAPQRSKRQIRRGKAQQRQHARKLKHEKK